MGVEFIHLAADCSHILSDLYPSVVNGAIDVGTQHVHGHTSLATYTLVPEIFVLCLEAFELQQFCDLDLQSLAIAALAQCLF